MKTSPTSKKRKRTHLRTDEFADTEHSLAKSAQTVGLVDAEPSEWKWLLIALHCAVQGIFVLGLSRGSGLLTLKSAHARKWLEAYRSEKKFHGPLDLDYFLELYEKVKRHALWGWDTSFQATAEHDWAVRKLNELRNEFIHFGAKGWSLQIAGLPSICLRCLEIVEHVGWYTEFVFWRSRAQMLRGRRSVRKLVRELRRLDRGYTARKRTARRRHKALSVRQRI